MVGLLSAMAFCSVSACCLSHMIQPTITNWNMDMIHSKSYSFLFTLIMAIFGY